MRGLRARFGGETARIKAEGGPVCAADLAGKHIPDSENAAVIYQKAFKLLPKDEPAVLGRFCNDTERAEDPKSWGQVKPIADRYAPALVMAYKAAEMPKCRFHSEWQKGVRCEFPHLRKLRFLGRLCLARSLLLARAGDMDGAVDCVRLAIRISESLKDEPGVIAALVRYAVLRTAAAAARGICDAGRINENQARLLSDAFAALDLRGSMTRALRGERGMGMVVFGQARAGRHGRKPPAGDEDATLSYGRGPFGVFVEVDEAYFLRTMREQIRIVEKPYRLIPRSARTHDEDAPRYAMLSSIMLLNGPRLAAARDRAVAELAGEQIRLGLLAYHDRFGTYPASLGELRSKLDWRVVNDPFSGKALVYRRKGAGFVLYSIGEDLKDNGGAERDGEKPGDIVWRRDR